MGKILLWFAGIVFIAYGLACFLSPELPARLASLTIEAGDGYAELGAMYGGLQIGVGVFCLLAGIKANMYRAGLTLLVLGIGLLGIARLYHAFDADWMVTSYTWGALAFELVVASLAAVALKR